MTYDSYIKSSAKNSRCQNCNFIHLRQKPDSVYTAMMFLKTLATCLVILPILTDCVSKEHKENGERLRKLEQDVLEIKEDLFKLVSFVSIRCRIQYLILAKVLT